MPRPGWINRAFPPVILAGLMVGSVAAAYGAKPAATDLNPVDLYRRSLTANQTVSYEGRQFITAFGEDARSSSYVTKVTHEAPDEYRIVYLAPHDFVGRTIIQTHMDQWTYRPRMATLLHTHVPQMAMTSDAKLRVLASNYKITRAAEPRIVAGRKTFEVIVQRKGSPKASERYWIDPYTGLALRTERYHTDGSPAMVSYFSDIKLNPKVSASVFDPTTIRPAGVQVLEKPSSDESGSLTAPQLAGSMNGLAVTPAKIEGYQLQGANILLNKGRETLHLRYSDGLSTLSLFESLRATKQPTVVRHSHLILLSKGVMARARHDVHYNTLNWDRGRLNMTLVGDIPEETLVRLAQGI